MINNILKIAEDEAIRFLARACDLRKIDPQVFGSNEIGYYTKEAGAVRRASLDLTRALADLRKPRS